MTFYSFAGLAPTKKTTAQSQRDIFAAQLASKQVYLKLKQMIGANYSIYCLKELNTGALFYYLTRFQGKEKNYAFYTSSP